ncbi:hypothetical protein [uncultured Alistipes sp.]|uniref:hypothetical protein n=1 Tax=uncultured Alistipes sp. TaxID=538949 RepID=UPI00272C232B|nr:hypothetical protein [uncultured Alistipes sp.]
MKTIYTVNYTNKVESHSISPEFSSEAEARAFFEKEKEKLAVNTPADITGWQDHDQAWSRVYQLELTKTTIDEEDGYIEDMVALDSTQYYYD